MMNMKKAIACLLALVLFPVAASASNPKEIAAYLGERIGEWRGSETVDAGIRVRLPVYAAPSRDAYRGANGKAEVSLKEPFEVWGTMEDISGSGEIWLLIEYSTHAGENRVGFVEKSALEPFASIDVGEVDCVGLTMTVERNAAVTDDPHGSMRKITTINKGSEVGVVRRLDDTWAYISTEIDGKAAYGLMKLTDLRMPEETKSEAFMQRLAGVWLFAGGGGTEGGMIFGADGSYVGCDALDEENVPTTLVTPTQSGSYEVIENPVGSEREKRCGRYELIRRFADGTICRNGIAFYEENRIHIASGESGAFYIRGTEDHVQENP